MNSDRLRELTLAAWQAESCGQTAQARSLWNEVLALLPAESAQFHAVQRRIADLPDGPAASAPAAPPGRLPATAGASAAGAPRAASHSARTRVGAAVAALGAAGLLLWKLKAVLLLVLSKLKLLLLGLSKASTFFSMFAAFGVYWTLYGWRFALGLVLSIYVHEMGHVFELRRLGVAASAPLFIPGLGAVIRLRQHFSNPRDDARVGLAGPIWGLAAAIVCYGVGYGLQSGIWLALGHVGAFINLFNLLPVWQLDGGRAFNAMSISQRWLALGVIVAAFAFTHEGLLVLLALGAAYRAFQWKSATGGDWAATSVFAALVIVLAWLARLHVPPEL